jgi:hypothetical protein
MLNQTSHTNPNGGHVPPILGTQHMYDNWLQQPYQDSLSCHMHGIEDCELCDPQYFTCTHCSREHAIEELNTEAPETGQCQSCCDRLEEEEL